MRRWDPLDALWEVLNRSSTGAILLIVLALSILVASLVPQAPGGLTERGLDFWLWYSSLPSPWKEWGPWLLATGAFDVRGTLWFRILLGLCTLHLLVNIVGAVRGWVDSRGKPAADLMQSGLEVHSYTTSLPSEQAIEGISRAFEKARYRVRTYRERTRRYFEAYGPVPPQAVRLLFHTGAFLVCLALLLSPYLDWGIQAPLVPGEPLEIAEGSLAFRLESLNSEDESSPYALASYIRDGETLVRGAMVIGRPLGFSGFQAHLVTLGPALRIRVSKAGEPVRLQVYPAGRETRGELRVPFLMANEEKYITLPDEGYILRCVLVPGSEFTFHLELFEGKTGKTLHMWEGKGPHDFTVEGISYELAPEQYAWIRVERSPSWGMMVAGGCLAGLAILAGITLPLGKAYGFLKEERKLVTVHWVQEDPIKVAPLSKYLPPLEERSG